MKLGANRAGLGIFLLLLILSFANAEAARIGDIVETTPMEQAARFFSLSDKAVQLALAGSVLLGISCGLLGAFLVVRKMALVGDVLSHAVLPGVALGFLWGMTKNPVAILIGATAAGLLGTFTVSLITRTTRLKEDAALGLVLASFFAVGLCLMGMIQKLPTAEKSGLDKFMFGQAAAMSGADITLMSVVTILTCLLVIVFYKELLVISFDATFARTTGIPVRLLHEAFMLLLAFSVVIALQAVGVVLVSAMLITPAAAAYLLTDRMHRMLILSAIFGVLAGVAGAFFSFLGSNLPTGPFMVLAASTIFAGAFAFSPKHGVVPRWWRRRVKGDRIGRENTLKAIYQVLEAADFKSEGVTTAELAKHRHNTLETTLRDARKIARFKLVDFDDVRGVMRLTNEGWRQAKIIVRNHRLWELYLTSRANYQLDHVHDDAERMEHLLGEDTVRELERRLNFPQTDPHGRVIPSVRETTTSREP